MKQSEIKKLAGLVERVKQHDEAAFVELYSQTHQKVFFLAYSVTRERYLAEDVVQEVYIKILESLDTLRDTEMFMAWLNRITYHTSLKVLDKQKDIFIEDTEIEKILVSEEDELLSQMINKEWRDILVDYILELPPELKSAIIMKYYEDMRMDEIAMSLDCPVGTVKSRLHNAKRLLRKKLMDNRVKVKGVFLGVAITLALDNYMKTHVILAFAATTVPEVTGGIVGLSSIGISAVACGKVAVVSACLAGSLITVPHLVDLNWGSLGPQPEIVSVRGPEGYTDTSVEEMIEVKSDSPIESVEVVSKGEVIPVECVQENKEYQVVIRENGTYQITVTASNHKQAFSQFEVHQIDKKNPRLANWSYDENTGEVTVTVQDDLSGVDYDKSYLEINGVKEKPDTWDVGKNQIRFHLDSKEAYLWLYDRCGNYNIYRLTLIEDIEYVEHKEESHE